jgi:FkbM family methyltransferase
VLRGIIERLSREIVLTRKLPSRFGGESIFVSPGVALRFWRFNLEKVDPVLFKAAWELVRSGDVVWDIGSSVGLFTFASAFIAGPRGRVLSIEPDSWTARLLSNSSRKNKGAPIDILRVAISDIVGIAEFMIAKRGRAGNFLKESGGSTQTNGVAENELVMTVTLDWLFERYPPPSVLKIDVEGGEEKVLKGATKMLATVQPRIFVEVYPCSKFKVTEILKGYGYKLYDAGIDPERREPLDFAVYNTIAYSSA